MNSITINDINIINFYNENPHLNITSINLIFIDILKNLSTNLSSTLDNAVNNQILSIVSNMKSDLFNIKSELYKLNSDILVTLNDNKKDYINDIKLILTNSEFSNNEKLNNLIEKSNDQLLAKTTLLINEVIPKSNDKSYNQIETCIKNFFGSLKEDTDILLKQTTNDKSKEVIENIEKNFNKMLSNIQQPIFSAIQTSETRTFTHMQQLNENLIVQKKLQDSVSNDLSIFLNKYKSNSSIKGAVSELELYSVLQKIVPYDQIIRCSNETASCDIRLNRRDKKHPTILFENKDYMTSVNTEEIEKFERDLKRQHSHGIFISQNSPITYKDNFQIDIIENLIHLYIPNAKYDQDKIKLAINIIDNLHDKINYHPPNGEHTKISLTNEDYEEIKEEYRIFANRKIEMLDTIKSITKQLTEKLEDIQLPHIRKLVAGKTDTKSIGIVCTICNKFTGKNRGSLAAHMKSCIKINQLENVSIKINT
jgi:hypothetical protein